VHASFLAIQISHVWFLPFKSTHLIILQSISTQAGAYSKRPFFFFSLKPLYVPFVLARDHLGKLEMEK
jgi:hypothetical protein